ncbi:MAG: hypothetical protein ACRC3B_03065 [Bacteroidia bacterium]
MRKFSLAAVAIFAGFSMQLSAQHNKLPAAFITATPLDKAVQLSWPTLSSTTASYVLEKSRNGVVYDSITWGGGCQSAAENIETDFSPCEGTSWYRLRLTDANGAVSFSNVVPVRYLEGNPVPLMLPIGECSKEEDVLLVVVTDHAGNEYYSKVTIDIDGNPVLATDLENRLHSGCYQIVACSDQNFYSRTLTVR